MTTKNGVDDHYWARRSNMMYYKYIDILVKAFAYEAQSIIDIGSANTKCIELFEWIPQKFTLDIKNPYSSPNVTAIETDFLTYEPNQSYDFVMCLQVLEHIPQVDEFAKKLFDLSDRVLISVPYMWPKGADPTHINDPIDKAKLKKWTGRDPSYSIIAEEPLRIPSKGISKRLICYYGPEGEEIDYRKANMNVEALKGETISKVDYGIISEELEENQQVHELILKNLSQITTAQKRYYQLIKLKLEIFNLEDRLKDKVSVNQTLEEQIESLKNEINLNKNGIHQEAKQQQFYLNEYNKILQSNSWKMMAPMRSIGSLFRKVARKTRS